MSGLVVALLGTILALVALLGAPLFVVIGATGLLCYAATGQDPALAHFWYYKMAASPLFVAIPLFAMAGVLLGESGSPQRIVNLSRALLGRMPGGLALVAVVACAWFTAFTGASGVTIIALGGLLFPILVKEKYPEEFSLGLLTTCGSLGLLFPPSLALIVYGLIAEVDIDTLFKAGLVPGMFLMAVLGGYSVITGYRSGAPRHPFSWSALRKALREALFELPIPVIIIGGIYGGFYTAAEAAGVTAFYVLIVECVIYRDIPLRELPRILNRTGVLVGAILVIMTTAIAFAEFLTEQEVPQALLVHMKTAIDSPITFLIALNIFLIVVGCMMDIFSAILVVVPLIRPIADHFGIDPVHLGIIFLTNLEIGYSTPPVGMNLFLASLRFERPIIQLYRVSLPFLGLLVVSLLIITYVPALSLALPAWDDGAVFEADRSDLPETAEPGEEITLVIRMKNAGSMTWNPAYRLRSTEGSQAREFKRLYAETGQDATEIALFSDERVRSGVSYEFEVDLQVPEQPGSYHLEYRMVHVGLWDFGDTVSLDIKVSAD